MPNAKSETVNIGKLPPLIMRSATSPNTTKGIPALAKRTVADRLPSGMAALAIASGGLRILMAVIQGEAIPIEGCFVQSDPDASMNAHNP